ncbi:hypothetical protein ACXZ1K_09040 [Pedobacter sp. PWIIR3]
MKNIIILAIITLLFSCKKENEDMQPENLLGKWEVRSILGVQVAGAPSQFAKGNGSIIEFSATNYKRIEGGKVITEGTYTIVDATADIDGNKYEKRILFDDEKDWRVFIKFSGKQLLICNGSIASDGSTVTYEKL